MSKKIYITALHLLHGGVEMSISLIANALVEKGYEVEILCSYNLGEPSYSIDPKVKITYLTDLKPNKDEFKAAVKEKNIINILKEGLYSVRVLREKKSSMAKAIKNIENGTILSTRNEHSVLLSKYGKEQVNKVAQLHHDHKFDGNLIKDFQNNYSNIDYFVLLTELLRDEVEEMLKGHNDKTKCLCIPNFLEEEEIENLHKEKQVVAVGRLHSVKGFDRLLDIWAIVSKECPEWKLKIIGGGEEEASIKGKINELDLNNSVELTGMLNHEETMKEMSKSGVFAMTSHSEGFPFVLIEALMCSTPIVAFDVRVGPRAIIEDGKEGYLIPDKELEQYANQLIKLMKDENLRNELSQNAKVKSKEFMKDKILEKWIEIL
ncbi:glycosyltransferase [Clostridium culturomicium]|uniref:glycosyltransferase n=1 Tax=Clostridium culturomicium TaxID=1499683 RepID=UPI00058B2F3B|nr:glycosyltransferase [Clostridium culturomicium]